MRKSILSIIFIIILVPILYFAETEIKQTVLEIPRLKYNGGGDWYNGKTELPNLLKFFTKETMIEVNIKDFYIEPDDSRIFHYPIIFLTGHGNITFNDVEIKNLRTYLLSGGFIYVDDDYGLNKPFRREIKKIFPELSLIEIDKSHKIFNCYFGFAEGLPKIHKHDGKPPQAFGLFDKNGRMMIFYTYESNISDGWDSPGVHNNPQNLRTTALKMGVNILIFALTN